MEKRYQFFVSSKFTDLIQERRGDAGAAGTRFDSGADGTVWELSEYGRFQLSKLIGVRRPAA
ncbi:MAG TPA: hypothetical protein VJ732_19590 [Bryobacteraceae bacterium]|nr:hypothetical protein [Bryobacteraceae bacterium]